jgi:phosphoglucosamine mutase
VSEKEKAEKELGDAGRVLIRASGTEPLIRVMVEAKTQELAETMARRIADKVTA